MTERKKKKIPQEILGPKRSKEKPTKIILIEKKTTTTGGKHTGQLCKLRVTNQQLQDGCARTMRSNRRATASSRDQFRVGCFGRATTCRPTNLGCPKYSAPDNSRNGQRGPRSRFAPVVFAASSLIALCCLLQELPRLGSF